MFAHLLAYIICRPAAKGSYDSKPETISILPFMKMANYSSYLASSSLPQKCVLTNSREKVSHGLDMETYAFTLCLGLSQLLFFWVFVTDLLFLLFLRLGEANFHLLTQYYNRSHWSRIACVWIACDWLSRVSRASGSLQPESLWAHHISVHTSMATILCRAWVPEDPLLGSVVKYSAQLPTVRFRLHVLDQGM